MTEMWRQTLQRGARLSGITIDQDKVLFNAIFFLHNGISSCPVTFVTRRLFSLKWQLLLLLS